MKKSVKSNDRILKKFFTFTVLSLCAFLLFFGIVFAKNNSERSLKGTGSEKIDETLVINKMENGFNEFISLFK